MDFLEDVARTGCWRCWVKGVGTYHCGERDVFAGSELAGVTGDIAAHEDEGVWVACRSSESAYVANSVL